MSGLFGGGKSTTISTTETAALGVRIQSSAGLGPERDRATQRLGGRAHDRQAEACAASLSIA